MYRISKKKSQKQNQPESWILRSVPNSTKNSTFQSQLFADKYITTGATTGYTSVAFDPKLISPTWIQENWRNWRNHREIVSIVINFLPFFRKYKLVFSWLRSQKTKGLKESLLNEKVDQNFTTSKPWKRTVTDSKMTFSNKCPAYLNLLSVKVFYRWIIFLDEASGHKLHRESWLSDSAGAQNDDLEFTHFLLVFRHKTLATFLSLIFC